MRDPAGVGLMTVHQASHLVPRPRHSVRERLIVVPPARMRLPEQDVVAVHVGECDDDDENGGADQAGRRKRAGQRQHRTAKAAQ